MTSRVQWSYRDVSTLLQTFRNFLLGRKHTLHPRFPCAIAPRSIPRPDIPRNMDYKYSEQYYVNRNSKDSVYPPVVAPIAMGAKGDTILKAESMTLPRYPTPGSPWWWDGHNYYECVADHPAVPEPRPPCPPMEAPPAPPGRNICETPPIPPCPQSPDKRA